MLLLLHVLLERIQNVLHLLRLEVELAQLVLVHHQRLLQILHASVEVASLEADEPEGQVSLGSGNVFGIVLILEEVLDHLGVLVRLQVVVLVDGRLRLHVHILLRDELLPNLDDLLVETLRLLHLVLLLEELPHVKVAAAQVDALGTVLGALQENSL